MNHDLDLVAHQSKRQQRHRAGIVKKTIGDRLKLNGRYAPILEEMPRLLATELCERISPRHHTLDHESRLCQAANWFPTRK
jgi:hypothetical protein